ncbi:SDR family oxidoreductase [Shewanella woodyi]|uniref:Short-chain dehydrogenase/reductase SDR n=1 Tax=Shewanella woodyi (strain ATCC 51908 / MS32) TaxID=392500 RepID=B1KFC4_SHEWM|nr:SDR family oxidoreductase [Shewanella woodyi]ACA86665.1 short-chain dehydrogenase/reductase SDR [Shewanella woodyi ATCC 51908]
MQKHLLITGANRGIGLTLVEQYLKDGWAVNACCRQPEKADELIQLQAKYESLTLSKLDVTDYHAVKLLADSLADIPIDLLINNAGYYGPKGVSFGDTDVEEWRRVIEINTIAPLKIAEAFLPHLTQAQDAAYVAISSKMGSMSDNSSGGAYIYRSSKAALNSVVKSLSLDLKSYGVKVVALHPGWVRTEMGGPNGLIDTNESAAGLKQVISELSSTDNGGFFDYLGNKIPW